MEEPKRGRGRPPKAPEEKLERLVLFVPPPVVAKVEKHGKDWARKVLEKAKPPRGE
ncbi:MAG TPA: hypothetical protein VIN03_11880 [Roseateles sp.]